MNENKAIIIKKWFSKGNNDLKNIENNLNSEIIPTDTVCFHAQQAIEKYFKGVIVYLEKEISKTHDLVKLLSEITDFMPELLPLEEDIEKISEFAVESRYPDSFYEPVITDAQQAYKLAVKIKEMILNKIKI